MWTKTFEDYFLVLCVLFINFCLFGIIRSGALLYVALIETFECSHELAAWPLTLAGSSICLIGKLKKFSTGQKVQDKCLVSSLNEIVDKRVA